MKSKLSFFTLLLSSILIAGLCPSTDARAASVVVSWDPNQESDLYGYRIYYGVRSGDYDRTVFAGDVTSFEVSGLQNATRYYFAVTALDYSGNESSFSEEVSIEIPADAPADPGTDPLSEAGQRLSENAYNYPNPFRAGREVTRIRYEIINPGEVTIDILDLNNQVVKILVNNSFRTAGEHTGDTWDGTNADNRPVAHGVYICRIRASGENRFIKIAVVR